MPKLSIELSTNAKCISAIITTLFQILVSVDSLSQTKAKYLFLRKPAEYYATVEPISRIEIKGRYGFPDMKGKRSDELGLFQTGTKLEIIDQKLSMTGDSFYKVKHPDLKDTLVWIQKSNAISFSDPRSYFEIDDGLRKFKGYILFKNGTYYQGSIEEFQFEDEILGLITLKIENVKEFYWEGNQIVVIVKSVDGGEKKFLGKFTSSRDEFLFVSPSLLLNVNQKDRQYMLYPVDKDSIDFKK